MTPMLLAIATKIVILAVNPIQFTTSIIGEIDVSVNKSVTKKPLAEVNFNQNGGRECMPLKPMRGMANIVR